MKVQLNKEIREQLTNVYEECGAFVCIYCRILFDCVYMDIEAYLHISFIAMSSVQTVT